MTAAASALIASQPTLWPYRCWLEVSEDVRWDGKKSLEPNLHVCGEDDIKWAVYNMKEGIEERGDRNIKNKKYSEENLMNQRTELVSRKN